MLPVTYAAGSVTCTVSSSIRLKLALLCPNSHVLALGTAMYRCSFINIECVGGGGEGCSACMQSRMDSWFSLGNSGKNKIGHTYDRLHNSI